jgi:hypothetical protein
MAASCWKHALPDIGKNSFGHDEGAAIVLRQKWSCGQVEARFANLPRLLAWRLASGTGLFTDTCHHC